MQFIVVILVILAIAVVFRSIKVVNQSQALVVQRLGRYHTTLPAGLHLIIPFLDQVYARVDLREQVLDYPPQPVITADNVTMSIDTVIYYQITDAQKATYEINNYRNAIEKLTQTTIRNVIGNLSLDETLTSRETINTQLRQILDEATDRWGIRVNRVELKTIEPPEDIRNAMELQMKAERTRRARVTEAEALKQSQILEAEGYKQAAIARAEGEKQRVILEAEAQKERQRLEAEGQAEAILAVNQSLARSLEMLREAAPDQAVLTLKAFEALAKVADGQATKLIIPSDLAGLAGGLAGLAEVVRER